MNKKHRGFDWRVAAVIPAAMAVLVAEGVLDFLKFYLVELPKAGIDAYLRKVAA